MPSEQQQQQQQQQLIETLAETLEYDCRLPFVWLRPSLALLFLFVDSAAMCFLFWKREKEVRRGVSFSAFLLNSSVRVNNRQNTANNAFWHSIDCSLSLASANKPLVDWKVELGNQNTVVRENTDLAGFRSIESSEVWVDDADAKENAKNTADHRTDRVAVVVVESPPRSVINNCSQSCWWWSSTLRHYLCACVCEMINEPLNLTP